MRVVHLSTGGGPLGGGASRAAYRIHHELRRNGVDSNMLCLNPSVSGDRVASVTQSLVGAAKRAVGPAFDRLQVRALGAAPEGMWSSGLLGLYDVTKHPLVQSADVLALYFVGAGFLSNGAISKILTLGKPVVWRLSDMWAFTGGCHYSGNCEKFTSQCGACPQLGSKHRLDASHWAHAQKQRWDLRNLTVVAPSRWLLQMAEASSVLGSASKLVIATGVDTAVFRPIPKAQARELLGLPLDRKLVLSGGLAETRKGGPVVVNLLREVFHRREDTDVIALQTDAPTALPRHRVHTLGRLNDEVTLALAYAAADVLMAPYSQDNLPNSVLEALACGTPVAGFDIGGIADAVEHEQTGLLCAPNDTNALRENLLRLLSDAPFVNNLARNARSRIEQRFDLAKQVARYRELYAELLERIPKARPR